MTRLRRWVGLGAIALLVPLTGSAAIAQSAAEYRQVGIAARDRGDLTGAIAALQSAVELEPENLSGQIMLGWTLHLAGEGRKAANTLKQAIALDPFSPQTFNALGIVYLVNDDLLAAIATHNWAAWIKPDNEIAHYNLSLAYQRLDFHEWAIAAAERAMALEPDNPHPVVALAIAYWRQGARDQALTTYQEAITMDARYGNAQFLTYLDQSGFSDEQIQEAQDILRSLN